MSNLLEQTAVAIRNNVAKRECSAEQVAAAFLSRIDEADGELKAFLHVDKENTLNAAREVDRRLDAGEPAGSLAGVPVAVKDNICTKGVVTTAASKMLEHFIPPYNATVIERLEAAGAVMIGKTNMDEFAMGSSCENSSFFATKNPWDTERVPGGSSGGSAVAVAARMAPLALGSDTGGSIRQPAAMSNTVGLKPTYGRVSRYGLIALASSLDQIGPFSRTVGDTERLFLVIAGKDPRDGTSVEEAVSVDDSTVNVSGMKIGVPVEFLGEGLDNDVREVIQGCLETLRSLGAKVIEVSLPSTEIGIAAYYVIAPAEASSNLARYDGMQYGYRTSAPVDLTATYRKSRSEAFGTEVKRRIMIGTYALQAGYLNELYTRALKVRRLVRNEFDRAFENVDVIVGPTSPVPPFKLGERIGDPLQMYLADLYTVTANLAGIPGLSVPGGFTPKGLPVGLQLLAPPFAENTLFRLGKAFEAETRYFEKDPPG